MDDYVQLPLTGTALRKWLRFSEKGGIGRAVSLADKLAESGTDELMFMEGEPITVLMQLNDGRYLGSCEGVVGIFHESDVRFLTKLKKPIFTKKPIKPDTYSPASHQPQPTPSPGHPHVYGSPATPHALSPAQTPIAFGERWAFSAPTSASALLFLQDNAQSLDAIREDPSVRYSPPGLTGMSNEQLQASHNLSRDGHPQYTFPATSPKLELCPRSPPAHDDNDDILSSYIYDRNADSESLSASTSARMQMTNRQSTLNRIEGGIQAIADVHRSQNQNSSSLLAPLDLRKLVTDPTDIVRLLDKPKLSQRVEVPPRVTILPNLPAGVSLKQLRERSSPRFPLSPRSISDSSPGMHTLASVRSKPQSMNPGAPQASGNPHEAARYADDEGRSWTGQSHTSTASPVFSGFGFVDSPLWVRSPISPTPPEHDTMATTASVRSFSSSGSSHQARFNQTRGRRDTLENQKTGMDGGSDARSLSSVGSSSRGLSHSRSMSSLTRAGSIMFQRRPSLPTRSDSNTGSLREEGVVELGNAQFQFVQPQAADLEGGSPHSTVDSLHSASTSRLITRPSASAKERVRSVYVLDATYDKFEEKPVIDKFGFIHSQHTLITMDDTDIPNAGDAVALQAYREREIKWINIMSTMSPRNARSSSKVKKLINHGIPNSVRGKAWTYLAEASVHKKGISYYDLCAKGAVAQRTEITNDIDLCFHDHSQFSDEDSIGRQDLQCVLYALLHHLPNLVYEQGLCYIAGMLLLHVEAESAFWLLVTTVVDYLPSYFARGREGSLIDANVLVYILQHGEPDLYEHLKNQNLTLDQIFRGWLTSAFVRTLPWPSQLRVMDLFFFGERPSQLGIRVGLALLDLLRDHLLARRQNAIQLLLSPPADLMSVSSFIPSLLTIKLPGRTFKKATKWAHGQRPQL